MRPDRPSLLISSSFRLRSSASTMFISDTTSTLSRLVSCTRSRPAAAPHHSIQSVQSDLYTVHTMLGTGRHHVDNVTKLDQAAVACGGCHHEPLSRGPREMQDMVRNYQKRQLLHHRVGEQAAQSTSSSSIRGYGTTS